MKTKIILLFTIFCLLAGCKKATYLHSDKNALSIVHEGGSDSLKIHTDKNNVQISSTPDWVKAQLADSILLITAKENPSNSPRKGNILLVNADQRLSIKVVQAGLASYMTLKEKSITIPSDGSEVSLEIDTDGSNVKVEGVDGVNSKFENGCLKITGKGNTGATRKTKANVICDSLTQTLLIIEEGTTCSRCHGKGRVICNICKGTGVDYCPYRTCDMCSGRLYVSCPECRGKGK